MRSGAPARPTSAMTTGLRLISLASPSWIGTGWPSVRAFDMAVPHLRTVPPSSRGRSMHDQEPRLAQAAPSGGGLIAPLRARDPRALASLTERHASHAFRVAFRLIRHAAASGRGAQDVL